MTTWMMTIRFLTPKTCLRLPFLPNESPVMSNRGYSFHTSTTGWWRGCKFDNIGEKNGEQMSIYLDHSIWAIHQHLVVWLSSGVFTADVLIGPSFSRALGDRTALLIYGPQHEVIVRYNKVNNITYRCFRNISMSTTPFVRCSCASKVVKTSWSLVTRQPHRSW